MDKSDNLAQFCYEKLREGIIKGDFLPEEKLKIEKLKAYTGTGPTPIREALSRLAETGLVAAEPNRGFFIKPISIEEVQDIYSTFLKIELLAIEQAIELGDSEWEARIISSLYKLGLIEKGKGPFDLNAWLKANYEFHVAIISGCNSPCLLKIRQDLYLLFERYCHLGMMFNKAPLSINHKEHEDITKAVIARDKVKAAKLIARHIEESLKLVLSQLKDSKHGK